MPLAVVEAEIECDGVKHGGEVPSIDLNEPSHSFSLTEPSMPRFVVRFMKDVLGENGQMREVNQARVELDARNELAAEQKAKQKFCDMHATHDWSLHADRVKVDSTDFAS